MGPESACARHHSLHWQAFAQASQNAESLRHGVPREAVKKGSAVAHSSVNPLGRVANDPDYLPVAWLFLTTNTFTGPMLSECLWVLSATRLLTETSRCRVLSAGHLRAGRRSIGGRATTLVAAIKKHQAVLIHRRGVFARSLYGGFCTFDLHRTDNAILHLCVYPAAHKVESDR